MKIILFRHGEKERTSDPKGDISIIHLTDNGISQVKKLGKVLYKKFPQLKNYPVIYSSLYARSIQTAQIVQSILNVKEIVQIPEFGEFIAYSNYQNSKDFREHLQLTAVQNPNWVSPETHTSLNQTISIFENKLKQICQKSQGNFVLISTHGGIIRHTVYSLKPEYRPSSEFIQQSKIHEAGYTILNYDGNNFSVDKFNVYDFL
jgi:broad specificity phosphatase PhoE